MSKGASKLILAVLFSLLVVQLAVAITIVVDGSKEAVWDSGAGGQTPGTVSDPDEGSIANTLDVQTIYYTNDSDYFYILLETHADTGWNSFTNVRADLCMDTDNNGATGFAYPNCVGMTGIDRFIRITGDSGALSYSVRDGTSSLIYNSQAGDIANSGTVTELRAPLTALGMSGGNCGANIQLNMYFDGGTTDPDDNTPDGAPAPVTCGSPTAISLQSMAVQGDSSSSIFFILGLMVVAFTLVGLIFRRHRPV